MDSVKTLFLGQAKDATLSNNQRNGYAFFAGRTLQAGNGLGNGGTSGNGNGAAMTDPHDMKRKDSDSYFYIMWRS